MSNLRIFGLTTTTQLFVWLAVRVVIGEVVFAVGFLALAAGVAIGLTRAIAGKASNLPVVLGSLIGYLIGLCLALALGPYG